MAFLRFQSRAFLFFVKWSEGRKEGCIPPFECELATVGRRVFAPGKCGGSKNYPQEPISERSKVIEVPKTSREKSVKAVKSIPQECSPDRRCEQSEVIKLTEKAKN